MKTKNFLKTNCNRLQCCTTLQICEVKKGQSINRKLTSDQTTKMLLDSKKSPNVLQSEIEQSVSALLGWLPRPLDEMLTNFFAFQLANLDLPTDPILKEFGCSFPDGVSLLEMSETRKLADPLLCYVSAVVLSHSVRI